MHPFFQDLKQGSQKLGLDLSEEALNLLLKYQDALVLWNKAYNLTAIRDPKEMLVKHLLDSLSILKDLPKGRLLDMGIEPFLIASTVNTIIGQRLVRRVATKRDVYQSSPIETQAIQTAIGHLLPKTAAQMPAIAEDLGYKDLPLAGQNAYTLAKGRDTPQTPRGYSGRAGLYEVMDVTEEIQTLITKQATSGEIERMAIAQGMVTMRQDGYLKALQGVTTLEEVNRVTADTA
jgi:hypothetical protein